MKSAFVQFALSPISRVLVVTLINTWCPEKLRDSEEKKGSLFDRNEIFLRNLIKSPSLEVHHYRPGQHNILYETCHISLHNIFSWWMVNRNFCEQGRLVSLLRLNSVLCSLTQFHFLDPDSTSLLFVYIKRFVRWNFVSSNYHMTWSAFALFLPRRTEFTFNIGHFSIILLFHSLLATFQVSISLIFDLFFKPLFWTKQIQGSERVKISLLVIFNFFPQINHFYYFTSLRGLQDEENHCAHLRDWVEEW